MPDSSFILNNLVGNFDPAPQAVPIPPAPSPAPPAHMVSGMATPASQVQMPSPAIPAATEAHAPAPNQGSPAAPSDPLAPVMQKIASGESGGPDPYHETYGGGHFGFPDLSAQQGPAGQTHAAGKYQFEPSTWTKASKEWVAANPNQPPPDFNKPQDQEKIARFWAQKVYANNTGGRNLVADAQTGKVDYSALASEWPSLGSPNLRASWSELTPAEKRLMQERQTATDNAIQGLGGMMQRYASEAAQAPPGSKEREALIAKYRDNLMQMQQEWRQKVAAPPIQKPMDAWAAFGNPAVILSLFAGLLSRQHLTAGLGAAGAAMKAINENNDRDYQRAYQTWKTQSDLGLQMISMENQDIRSLLDDQKMAVDEKQARLQTLHAEMGMMKGVAGLQLDNLDNAEKIYSTRAQAAQQMQMHMDNVQMHHDSVMIAHEDRLAGLQLRGAGSNLNEYGDPPDDRSDNPNKPTPGSNIPQSVWDGATQLALTGHMPVLGNSAQGRAKIQSALPWVLAARGMTPADMTQQGVAYSGALAGERTLATRLANLDVGLSEVPHLGDQLLEVSDATPRTQFMTVNQLVQAAQLRTGDPQVVRLGAAMNSYLQGYARAINPTGVITDDIRAHVGYVLNQAMAKGQIRAGVEQLNKELTAMQEGLKDAAARGKTMFPLPGEPAPQDPSKAPTPGSVPIPKAKYRATGPGPEHQKFYSDDGTNWYDVNGVPVGVPH